MALADGFGKLVEILALGGEGNACELKICRRRSLRSPHGRAVGVARLI